MVRNRERYLAAIINKMAFGHGKMAFISGPRQVGKTTLSQRILGERSKGAYRNWDDKDFRKDWIKGPAAVTSGVPLPETAARVRPLIIFDELHKAKGWKGALKGIFDLYRNRLDIIVTGSARLNVFKKGGDSLLGRYFSFRLNPLSVAELTDRIREDPDSLIASLFVESPGKSSKICAQVFRDLMKFGGFPEPYFAADAAFANLWRRGRLEKIIREDLRDLSRLPELSQVEMLTALLPDRVGSPLSIQSLREDLEVAHDTVKRWMDYLGSLYYLFTIRPWSKSLVRSIKKEPKIYLYDWTEIDNEGARFENLVAVHLKKACEYWVDSGHEDWQLHYLRNKEKKEVDFLLTRNDRPILGIECKLAETNIDTSFLAFARHIGLKHHIQVVAQSGHWKRQTIDGITVLMASADQVLAHFV
jgi:predicted AAA+ superfamily ATPase